MEVDQAYIVSLDALIEVCKELSVGNFAYKIVRVEDSDVTISFNDGVDDLNPSHFTFPIVRNLGLPVVPNTSFITGESLMICLHVYTHRQTRHKMYMSEGEIKFDGITDWLKFWVPMDALLLKKSKLLEMI